uniref:Small ribosomal subunit protein uS17 n=1 Tax=Anncaliia algerae TaxID=723287 RepID=E3PYC7_9MICR|nr:40S RIBOSOMAL PROTEIN S11 [Anncaliia algerae]
MQEITRKDKTFPQQSQAKYIVNKEQKRHVKNIGLGFVAPQTAINGTYIDKKCPFTGNVSIRGRILKGEVYKMKQERTIVVRKNYFHYVPKYKRFERRNSKFSVHLSPCFLGLVNVGDIVTIAETRPLSKTKRFVVVDYQSKKKRDDDFIEFNES